MTELADGYHELYNDKNEITKKGMFKAGKQISGIKNVYNKDGNLSHTETCINGVYNKEILKNKIILRTLK